jgi:DNA polymerase/3'-5' exonuclease PolX
MSSMDKNKIAEMLVEIGMLLELKGENPFKTRERVSKIQCLF